MGPSGEHVLTPSSPPSSPSPDPLTKVEKPRRKEKSQLVSEGKSRGLAAPSSTCRLMSRKYLYAALLGLLIYSAILFRSFLNTPATLRSSSSSSSSSSASSSSSSSFASSSASSSLASTSQPTSSVTVASISTESTLQHDEREDVCKYVNPFVGTGAEGHTYPGATVPFGMVQVSPSSGNKQWSWCSGYHYRDSRVISFGHLHLSGTGIGDGFDISLFPYTSAQTSLAGDTYTHNNETASPGYYSVHLASGIFVELTATNRTGVHRYTFPKGSAQPSVNLHLGYGFDQASSSSITLGPNSTSLAGFRRSDSWAKNHVIFFSMELSCPYTVVNLMQNGQLRPHDKSVSGGATEAQFFFAQDCPVLIIKVGVSSSSAEGAALSLLKEAPGFDFDRVHKEARESWQQELSQVELEGEEEDKRIFYTALYHTKLAPTLHSDLLGGYHGPSGQDQIAKHDFYSTFSIWDTFRACHPLHTLLSAKRVPDMLKSMIAHYNVVGALPVWSLFGQETNTMPGYHGVSLMAESILKGFDPGASLEKVFESLKASAGRYHEGLSTGFVPMSPHSVTKTLEFAYDDWCVAEIAKKLKAKQPSSSSLAHEHETFVNRSKFWKNLFDPDSGFMRAKHANGKFTEPFNPLASSPYSEYTEGTAWQHIWFVPHAVPEFVEVFGGPAKFEKKLDEFFMQDNKGFSGMVDITGLIGQYAHGNEPSHHVAYLYNYVGRPEKTQTRVRQILKELYSNRPDGLSGNEDCGQMSAWYVFSAMGMYPVNPVSGEYQLGSPLFRKVVLHLENGKTFTISAPQTSPKNILVSSVSLNGEVLKRSFITHSEILNGGQLEFHMKV